MLAALTLAGLSLSGCEREEGPGERTGERVDEAVEQLEEGDNPLKREGTGEEVGEELDEATETERDS